MQIEKTALEDAYLIYPKVFSDDRGYFFESYNEKIFCNTIGNVQFVQDNESKSSKNVLRGLHYQKAPYAQGKLVRVIRGSVLDVIVDIRAGSTSFGKHFTTILSESNKTMLWIPKGFAHGFLTLEDQTIFSYKCTQYYHKESEESILWSDPNLNINWGIKNPIISEKDKSAKLFSTLFSN